MLGFEVTLQPPSEVVVDQIFSFAFHCPLTSRSFSKIPKTFTPNNSFATAKLVELPTLEDIEDDSYILGCLRANFSPNVVDRILRFEIGIRIPGVYKILMQIRGKSSDWNTSLHYPVISDLWSDEIHVKEPPPSQPASENLPPLNDAEIAPNRYSESLVVEDGNEDPRAIPLATLETGLPSAYYKILMEAPLTSDQRTFLIEAMTAVTANKNQDGPKKETEDFAGDDDGDDNGDEGDDGDDDDGDDDGDDDYDDEGGVVLSRSHHIDAAFQTSSENSRF